MRPENADAVREADVQVSWSTVEVEDGAEAGTDYTAVASTTVTLRPSEREKAITVQTTQDDVIELTERFKVRLTAGSKASVTTAEATVSINDDDEDTVVTLQGPPGPVTEGEAATLKVVRSKAAEFETYVTYFVRDGTASSADYTVAASRKLTLAPGEKEKTFTIQTTQDDIVEGPETFTVRAGGYQGIVRPTGAPTVTIADDDTATIAVSGPAAAVEEGDAAVFTVTMSKAASSQAIVWAGTALSGQTPAEANDFTAKSVSLTFAPGETTKTISIQTSEDTRVEEDETFVVRLSEPTLPAGVTLGAATATATIEDDDTLTASLADITVSESAGTAALTATLSQAAERTVTLAWATSDGTAAAGSDYTAASGTVTFTAGATNRQGRVEDGARVRGVDLRLPADHVVAERIAPGARGETLAVTDAAIGDRLGVDIGPRTRAEYAALIAAARTVVWNGPLGVFEVDAFAAGTLAVARAVAETAAATVVGGGDSIAALAKAGVQDRITHVSTGGGASLEFLSGRTLPGVAALPD